MGTFFARQNLITFSFLLHRVLALQHTHRWLKISSEAEARLQASLGSDAEVMLAAIEQQIPIRALKTCRLKA